MNALILALSLASTAPQTSMDLARDVDAVRVAAGSLGGGAGAIGAGGPFSGGTLSAPLVLDATNTLCNQALSLSFNGDSDLGLQRSAANILRLCASSGVIFNGPIVTASVGGCSSTDIQFAGGTNRGISFDDTIPRILFCLGGAGTIILTSSAVTIGNGVNVVTATTGAFQHTGSAAGTNARIESAANASGEIAVTVGTTAALAGATLDTTLLAAAHDTDGTPANVFLIQGSGHADMNGVSPSDFTSGSCTNDSGTGDDFHGVITADCTAQTAIVTFGRAWAAAPVCWVGVSTGLPTVLSWTTTTAALTITATSGAGAKYTYQCWEP